MKTKVARSLLILILGLFISYSPVWAAPYNIESTISIESKCEICDAYKNYIIQAIYETSPFCRRIVTSDSEFQRVPLERLNIDEAVSIYTPVKILNAYPTTSKYDNDTKLTNMLDEDKSSLLERGSVKIYRSKSPVPLNENDGQFFVIRFTNGPCGGIDWGSGPSYSAIAFSNPDGKIDMAKNRLLIGELPNGHRDLFLYRNKVYIDILYRDFKAGFDRTRVFEVTKDGLKRICDEIVEGRI